MGRWLGIDSGGTYLKAGVYDENGHEYAIARRHIEVLSPRPGWAERDMDALWRATAEVIREALSIAGVSGNAIRGVGISGQGKGLFLLDRANRPLGNALLSADQRALPLVQRWQEEGVPEAIYPRTRQTLWTGHPVSLLRWVKDNEPDRYAAIGTVLMGHDYLRFRLTGERACEQTNISESNLFDMNSGAYDALLADLFGIPEAMDTLPPVVGSAEIAGRITPQAAEETGLAIGTPVVGGLFDVVSTCLCAGIADDTQLNAVMGTWSVTTGVTQTIDAAQTYPFVYGRHAQPGSYIVHEASPTSAGNIEWLARQFGDLDYAAINAAVESLPKLASDVLFIPFLYGSNAGLGMRAGFYGMQAFHTQAHLLQAAFEGVVFSHLHHLSRIQIRFPNVRALRVTGGPARSRPWMQILADASGLPLELPRIEETGCLGAAMAAEVGTGAFADFWQAIAAIRPAQERVEPDPAAYERYRERRERYEQLLTALRGFETKMQPGRVPAAA